MSILHPIKDIDTFIDKIVSSSKIIGIGEFSHGTSQCYKIRAELIKRIVEKVKKVDIYLESTDAHVRKINRIITGKEDLKLNGDYNYRASFPLMDYVGYRIYDCVEMLDLINKLKDLNKKYDIRIFGVDVLFQKNSNQDLRQPEPVSKEDIYKVYPQLKDDNSNYSQFLVDNIDLYGKRDQFMYEAIKFLHNKRDRIGIYLGHNWHVGYYSISNFESTGRYLNNHFGDKYVAIQTSSACGSVRVDGEMDKFGNIDIYKKPESVNFIDKGSLAVYVKKTFPKKDCLFFEVDPKTKLSIFQIGWSKPDYQNESYYVNVLSNYMIHFFETSATHNISV